jgi:hypothetical protein
MTSNIKVELSFKIYHSGKKERVLPPGQVQLRIGNSRVMIVDAADVAGMALTMVKEGVKKRVTRKEKREMKREEKEGKGVCVSAEFLGRAPRAPRVPEDTGNQEWC